MIRMKLLMMMMKLMMITDTELDDDDDEDVTKDPINKIQLQVILQILFCCYFLVNIFQCVLYGCLLLFFYELYNYKMNEHYFTCVFIWSLFNCALYK